METPLASHKPSLLRNLRQESTFRRHSAKWICTPASNLRDVGVAGSNPVTPTIDFHRVFLTPPDYGSGSKRLTVPKTVPVLAEENRAIFRLSVDPFGQPNTMKFRGLGTPQPFRDFLKS